MERIVASVNAARPTAPHLIHPWVKSNFSGKLDHKDQLKIAIRTGIRTHWPPDRQRASIEEPSMFARPLGEEYSTARRRVTLIRISGAH